MGSPYGHRYRQARALLLATNPDCHWCAQRGVKTVATTADHEPPIHEVGTAHLNLVPACARCNYGRKQREQKTASPSREW